MSDWIAYDRETGEVREDAKIRLPEDIRKQNKWVGYKNICDMKSSVDKSYFKFFISQFENITDLKPQTLARLMYLSTKINQHKLLGYVFMMLPYVNIRYNILCYNPFENVMDFIIPITMNNFCDYIGVGTEQVNRFRKNIETIIFTFNGREQHFLCFILSANVENKNHGMIMINPNILYGRNIIEREGMIELFYRHDTNKRINTKLEVGGSNE